MDGIKMDEMYMDIAHRVADMSYAERKKVGAIIVKDGNIVSFGWNGTPEGFDNNCEVEIDGRLKTKPEVIHAEQNALAKAAKGVIPVDGGTLYITFSPCWNCAGSALSAGISRVVYDEPYRDSAPLDFLKKGNVKTEQIFKGYKEPT